VTPGDHHSDRPSNHGAPRVVRKRDIPWPYSGPIAKLAIVILAAGLILGPYVVDEDFAEWRLGVLDGLLSAGVGLLIGALARKRLTAYFPRLFENVRGSLWALEKVKILGGVWWEFNVLSSVLFILASVASAGLNLLLCHVARLSWPWCGPSFVDTAILAGGMAFVLAEGCWYALWYDRLPE